MKLVVHSHVPEECEFLDEGWEVEIVEIPGPFSLSGVYKFLCQYYLATEVDAFRVWDKVIAV